MDPQRWQWVVDMNADGRLTIRDVFAWLLWLFFYPGDLLLYSMGRSDILHVLNGVAAFLELPPLGYGGIFSFAISTVTWAIIVGVFVAIRKELPAAVKDATRTVRRSIERIFGMPVCLKCGTATRWPKGDLTDWRHGTTATQDVIRRGLAESYPETCCGGELQPTLSRRPYGER